jgi:hypothetical protein
VVVNRLPPGARLQAAYPEGGARQPRVDAHGVARLQLAPQSVLTSR